MSVPSIIHEKNKSKVQNSKIKDGTSNKSDNRSTNDNNKKSNASTTINTHRVSGVEKSLGNDTQEKGSGEPYVYECRDFPGVTIIVRTLNNPKASANFDGIGKGGTQGSRRKSEFIQSQTNVQDKSEHGDKNDHSGVGASNSTNNSHETSGEGH